MAFNDSKDNRTATGEKAARYRKNAGELRAEAISCYSMTERNHGGSVMKHLKRAMIIPMLLGLAISACGDKKDSAARDQEAQKAIQEGMQKERKMYEGMQKGAENMEKKIPEQKEQTQK
jgi:hypothetical protein